MNMADAVIFVKNGCTKIKLFDLYVVKGPGHSRYFSFAKKNGFIRRLGVPWQRAGLSASTRGVNDSCASKSLQGRRSICPKRNMNVCRKCHSNSSTSCRDVSVETTSCCHWREKVCGSHKK